MKAVLVIMRQWTQREDSGEGTCVQERPFLNTYQLVLFFERYKAGTLMEELLCFLIFGIFKLPLVPLMGEVRYGVHLVVSSCHFTSDKTYVTHIIAVHEIGCFRDEIYFYLYRYHSNLHLGRQGLHDIEIEDPLL